MKILTRMLAVGGLALGTLTIAAGPASAAVGATIDSVDRNGCVLTVNATVEDAGTYALAVFDDDLEIGGSSIEADAGASIQLTYTIVSNVNENAPGLGLYIFDAPDEPRNLLADLDPYDFPGSDTIAAACAASSGEDSGETTPPTTVTPTTATPTTATPATTAPTGTTLPAPSSADEPPSNAEAPSSAEDAPSNPAPALQPKFTG